MSSIYDLQKKLKDIIAQGGKTVNTVLNTKFIPGQKNTISQSAQKAWQNNAFNLATKTNTGIAPIDTVARSAGQFGKNYLEGMTFNTLKIPTQKPANNVENIAGMTGNIMGAFSPYGAGAKILSPVGKIGEKTATKLVTTIAPKLASKTVKLLPSKAPAMLKRVIPSTTIGGVTTALGGELAQTGTLMGARGAANQEFNPVEDLAYGIGARGLLRSAGAMVPKASMRMETRDRNILEQVTNVLRNPDQYITPEMIGKHGTAAGYKLAKEQARKNLIKQAEDYVYKFASDYAPDNLLGKDISALNMAYKLLDLDVKNKLAYTKSPFDIPKMGLVDDVKPNIKTSSEGIISKGKTGVTKFPTQTEILNRAEIKAGKPDLFMQRHEKLVKAGVIRPKRQEATEEILNDIRTAIQYGDMPAARQLYKDLDYDFILPKFEKLELDVKQAEETFNSAMRDADTVIPTTPGYEGIVNKMRQLLKTKGEAVNSEGTLYREHIPAKALGQSSDEVASALGMTESEFMRKLTNGIEMGGEKSVRQTIKDNNLIKNQQRIMSKNAREIQLLDKKIQERKQFNEYYNPIRQDGKLVSVSVKADPKTIDKVNAIQNKNQIKEYHAEQLQLQRAIREQLGEKSTNEMVEDISRMIREATDKGYKERNPITVKQKIGILDYFRTPERVLQKIGLGDDMTNLRRAYESYQQELPKEINKITAWFKKAPKDSSQRIFRYLDGQGQTLSNDEKVVADEIKDYLKQWADRLGLPEDKRITNYITHIFDPDFIQKEFDPDFAALIRDKIPGSVYDPFVQQRLGKQGYIEDVWKALDAYTKRAVRKVNMDPVLKQIKQKSEVFEDSQYKYIKAYIDRINMRPTSWDNAIDNTIKQVVGYRFGQRPTTFITQKLRQAVYRGTLGLNIGSALRNLTQGANTYAKIGEKHTIIGYTKMAKALLSKDDEMFRVGALQSDLIEDRTINATKKLWEKTDKGLWVFFDLAEKINRGAAYYGGKSLALSKGMNEEQAIEYGKKLVRDTQFTFGSIDTPQVLQSDLAKTLLQFQSYNLKQAEFLIEMAKNKEYAGFIRYALAGFVALNTIGQAIGMKPTDFIPFYSYLSGEGQSKFGETPPIALGKEVAGAFLNTPDEYGQPIDIQKRVERLGKKLVPFIPAGVQIKKTLEGKIAYDKGYDESPSGRIKHQIEKTPLNEVRASLFGKYQTPEAREYFDKDRKPLGEKQSEIFKKLDEKGQKEYLEAIYKTRENEKLIKEIKAGIKEGKNVDHLINQVSASEDSVDMRAYYEAQAEKAKNKTVNILDQKARLQEESNILKVKLKVESTGEPQIYNNKYYYINENGNPASIDMDFTVEKPELTGQEALDKKLKSKYQGEITTKQNNIVKLYEKGVFAAEEAQKKIEELEAQRSGSSSGGKAKKWKNATIKKTAPIKINFGTIKKRAMPTLRLRKAPKVKAFNRKIKIKAPDKRVMYKISRKELKGLDKSIKIV